jgi:hypothetical protein
VCLPDERYLVRLISEERAFHPAIVYVGRCSRCPRLCTCTFLSYPRACKIQTRSPSRLLISLSLPRLLASRTETPPQTLVLASDRKEKRETTCRTPGRHTQHSISLPFSLHSRFLQGPCFNSFYFAFIFEFGFYSPSRVDGPLCRNRTIWAQACFPLFLIVPPHLPFLLHPLLPFLSVRPRSRTHGHTCLLAGSYIHAPLFLAVFVPTWPLAGPAAYICFFTHAFWDANKKKRREEDEKRKKERKEKKKKKGGRG